MASLDFLKLRSPRVGPSRQAKFYLSQEAFARLQSASKQTGLDMSMIVNNMLLNLLPDPEAMDFAKAREPRRAARSKQHQQPQQDKDFAL